MSWLMLMEVSARIFLAWGLKKVVQRILFYAEVLIWKSLTIFLVRKLKSSCFYIWCVVGPLPRLFKLWPSVNIGNAPMVIYFTYTYIIIILVRKTCPILCNLFTMYMSQALWANFCYSSVNPYPANTESD